MKIIVTGVNGFLGRNFYENIQKNKDIKIFCISRKDSRFLGKDALHIKCDLNDYELTKKYINEINPDIIYHFAANPNVKDNTVSMLETNIIMTDKLLRSCKNTRFVFASSATVYGQLKNTDHGFKTTDNLNPESLYAVTKVQSEELIKYYQRVGNINKYIIYRYVANVGKYATHGVLIDIYNKILNANNYIDIIGSYPGTIKPFTLASQSMKITYLHSKTFFSLNNNGIFNVSPSDFISINDLVDIVLYRLNKKNIEKRWLGEKSTWIGDQKLLKIESEFNDILYSSREAINRAISELVGTKI